jgi:hypothetical protein
MGCAVYFLAVGIPSSTTYYLIAYAYRAVGLFDTQLFVVLSGNLMVRSEPVAQRLPIFVRHWLYLEEHQWLSGIVAQY